MSENKIQILSSGDIFVEKGVISIESKLLGILNKLQKYENFNLYFYSDENPLHAKLIVSDGKRAILGSANISDGGLIQNDGGLIQNHEIAVYIEGEKAWTLKKLAKNLIKNLLRK